MGGTPNLKDGHDNAVAVVRRLLANGEQPAECDWAGFPWDDGRVWYRVTIVGWPSGETGELVKVVIGCAQHLTTFAVPNGPAPTVSRYLDLTETQRSQGWSVYPGAPDRDRAVWIHLARAVVQVQDAFDVRALHREHDRTFGLVVRHPSQA